MEILSILSEFPYFLIRCLAGNANGDDAVADGVELLVGGFFESVGRCLAVDCIYHHLLRSYLSHCLKPWPNVFLSGVVHAFAIVCALHKHGLDDELAVERLHCLDDSSHVVLGIGSVHLIYIYRVDGVEFEDVVVNINEGIAHFGTMDECGVAQHRHLRLREILVAQSDDIPHDGGKLGVGGWFAVTRKGEHVGRRTICLHILHPLLRLLARLILSLSETLSATATLPASIGILSR